MPEVGRGAPPPLPLLSSPGNPDGPGRVSGMDLARRGRDFQDGACLFRRGRGGPISRAARGAGPVRGCGALRGGRRRQKRGSRGLPVGAARSWQRDWLRLSRVRGLLGFGRAPRPRAPRPLTARYVLAPRLRCGARAPRARRRRRRRRELRAVSPGSGGGVSRAGRASTCRGPPVGAR